MGIVRILSGAAYVRADVKEIYGKDSVEASGGGAERGSSITGVGRIARQRRWHSRLQAWEGKRGRPQAHSFLPSHTLQHADMFSDMDQTLVCKIFLWEPFDTDLAVQG